MGERMCVCGDRESDHKRGRVSLSPFGGAEPAPGLCILSERCGCTGFREAEPHEDWTPGDAA